MAEKRSEEGKQRKIEYIREYNQANYDRMEITMPKGLKDIYKEYAKNHGLSLSGLICTAVNNYMNIHTVQNNPEQEEKE